MSLRLTQLEHPDTKKPVLPAIFLMGPTAVGKTQLAVELQRQLPCEIISVDSAMVYRGMDIGTAKPEKDILRIAPHRLIDFLDPAESYSAAQFRADALREMSNITSLGKIPLLVGGTMLYYRALEYGLADLPPANPEVRARLDEQARIRGRAALHEYLRHIDPQAARRIHPNDPQRLQRALEVYEITGIPMSEFIKRTQPVAFPYRLLKLALVPSNRDRLKERIALRFKQMLSQGLIGEVESLYQREDLKVTMPSMRTVGYRQVWDYLEGRNDYETMNSKVIIATRQLAKRQLTWLRAEPNIYRFEAESTSSNEIVEKIYSYASASTC